MTTASMQEFVSGELIKMVEEKWLGRVIVAFTEAIDASFETDAVLRPVRTRNEIERRFRMCIRMFTTWRRDLGWAVPRILDTLPLALRCELDGMRYEPDEVHTAWMKANTTMAMQYDGADMAGPVPMVNGVEVEGI